MSAEAQAGQDPAPAAEPERVKLRYGMYATYVLREKPPPAPVLPPGPDPFEWNEGDPDPLGPLWGELPPCKQQP